MVKEEQQKGGADALRTELLGLRKKKADAAKNIAARPTLIAHVCEA